MTSKKPLLLVTAFEPFGGAKTNSSHILLERLRAENTDARIVFLGPVPVTFNDAWPSILAELEKYPDIQGVIALGQAEGRACLSLECFATNFVGGSTPDNAGVKPRTGPISASGPRFIKTGFPWNKLEKSDDWEQSTHAGTYVCNHVMYQAAEWAKKEGKTAGFIHVPLLKSQGKDPAFDKSAPRMDDDRAVESFRRVLGFAVESLEAKMPPAPANTLKKNGPKPPKLKM